MNPGERAALEDRVCLSYDKMLPDEAHRVSLANPERVPYRCPFGHGHWHAERLTVDEMKDVARMIRDRREATDHETDPNASDGAGTVGDSGGVVERGERRT